MAQSINGMGEERQNMCPINKDVSKAIEIVIYLGM